MNPNPTVITNTNLLKDFESLVKPSFHPLVRFDTETVHLSSFWFWLLSNKTLDTATPDQARNRRLNALNNFLRGHCNNYSDRGLPSSLNTTVPISFVKVPTGLLSLGESLTNAQCASEGTLGEFHFLGMNQGVYRIAP